MSTVREIRYVATGDNHYRHIAQIVATNGWHLTPPAASLGQALSEYAAGRCAGIIVEDTQTLPVGSILFEQLRNPLLYLAPLLVVIDRDRPDDQAGFEKHFNFSSLLKPISRMMVVTSFSDFTRKISSNAGKLAQEIAGNLAQSTPAMSSELADQFAALSTDAAYTHRAVAARSLVPAFDFAESAMKGISFTTFKSVEADLLRHAKSHSGNLLAFLILAGFYADFSMTMLARRLMQSAASTAQRFSVANIFLAQLHLMLGEETQAIEVMNRLIRMRYCPELTGFALAKLYFSTGQSELARNVLQDQGGRFQTLKAAWIDPKQGSQ